MSTFASIAVLSKPTELKPDWEFEMEGLKFAVHDGMVELNQEIHDFERFSSALNNVFLLIDNIESNKGKLDEAVYSLVNQNNELAEALGIYTPFNLKSDEGQRQAGFELRMALEADENQDGNQKKNDSGANEEDDKGFFAKAWEAIKNFFSKIWNAVKGIFVKGEELAKNEDAKNKATLEKMKSMNPNELAQAISKGLVKVHGIFLSPESATAMVKGFETISKKISNFSQVSALDYFDKINENDKIPYGGAFQGIEGELAKFGIRVSVKAINGENKSVCEISEGVNEYRTEAGNTKENIRKFFGIEPGQQADPNKAGEYIAMYESYLGSNGQLNGSLNNSINTIKKSIDNLHAIIEVFKNEKEVDKIVAQRSASLLSRAGSAIARKLHLSENDKSMSSSKAARIRCAIAKSVGEELAGTLKAILNALNKARAIFGTTRASLRQIIDSQVERAANKDMKRLAEYDQKEQAIKEARAQNIKNDNGNYGDDIENRSDEQEQLGTGESWQ